jgi:C_GCAxxG_C_C family probable redox protein
MPSIQNQVHMDKSQRSVELFENGFSCAQSVLFSWGGSYFSDPLSALKLTSGFGAGISYRGEMCGAVSASLMVIGLHYGYSSPENVEAKELSQKLCREFMDNFEKRNGSVICNRLLNARIDIPETLLSARELGLFRKVCPALVRSASEILGELFLKYPVPEAIDAQNVE